MSMNTPGTRIDDIGNGLYRISTPVSPDTVPGGFSFNQYLLVDEAPLLFHTGLRRLFEPVSRAIESVLPLNELRYISFCHVEADECGSLNEFLQAAPRAEVLCGQVAAMTSVADLADRPPRALSDGEALSLGARTVVWLDAPHVPHGWENGFLFEQTTRLLFCGDLFTQPGSEHAPVSDDVLDSSEQMRRTMDYFAHGANTGPVLERLAALQPQTLACMHGSAFQGDGAAQLRKLADRLCGAG
ncbi:MBL fold metallo-hydrolase [Seongchinamella unica]|uniref:MBL fold metallo-hydrolase n=2 Tax=Seongchinamella unica TaxID=2547392 RepID=A0A4R5LN16_9GAMM|nr:MBL fold metallo-hydrolase [Seongchinamella unica]